MGRSDILLKQEPARHIAVRAENLEVWPPLAARQAVLVWALRAPFVLNGFGKPEEVAEAQAKIATDFKVRVLVIGAGAFFTSRAEQLAALALRYAVPTVYEGRDFVMAGGLLSYGGSLIDSYRLADLYAGRVLKGEKPADLSVQQSTKVEIFLNLRTAKTLGITVPLPNSMLRGCGLKSMSPRRANSCSKGWGGSLVRGGTNALFAYRKTSYSRPVTRAMMAEIQPKRSDCWRSVGRFSE